MSSSSEISLLVDALLVETALSEPKFYKKGGELTDIVEKVKEYFSSKVEEGHTGASIIDILAPGTISVLLSSMGFTKWGLLLGGLFSMFHVDTAGLLRSIWKGVKELIHDDKPTSSQQVDQVVDSSIAAHSGDAATANDSRIYSSLELMPKAKLIRLALVEYEDNLLRLTKVPVPLISTAASKGEGTSLLGKIFGIFIKIALVSAGLMVAGDIANSLFGRPNSLDHTYQKGKEPVEAPPAEPANPISTQKKYPAKPDSPISSNISMANNPENIENKLIEFTKDAYSGLDGKEELIRNTPTFQDVKENVVWYNSEHPGSTVVVMPPEFTSKKRLADYFIDDVAKSDA